MEIHQRSAFRSSTGMCAWLGLVILATACSSQQVTPGVVELPEAKPVLIDCPAFMPGQRTGERGLTGAQLRIQVGTDGRPMAITPVQGPSAAVLEEATEVARSCVFEPARQGGEPITTWARLSFQFREVVVM